MIDFIERSFGFFLSISIPYVVIAFGSQDTLWPLLIWSIEDPVTRMILVAAMIVWVCASFSFCFFTGNGLTAQDYLDDR